MKKVLFVCVHNSVRSQMAEAFAGRLGDGVIEAESAGTLPADGLNPVVVQAMQEIGYDLSAHYPKIMTDEMADSADLVITMGCGVSLEDAAEGAVCPVALVPSEDWALDDPKGQPIEKVRAIRDEIKSRVEKLVKGLEVGDERDQGNH
jgi:arsenate reductase